MASGSATGRTAARSLTVVYTSGKASIGARVGCIAATWRRCSVSALLQAQIAILRVSVISGGKGGRGGLVLSAGRLRLPLGVSSIGAGGWAKRTSRPRGRRRSAGCLLRPHERSEYGGCGGPVLDVDVAHLGLVVEVAVRHLWVVGRRRDHDDPERGAGGRRGRAATSTQGASTWMAGRWSRATAASRGRVSGSRTTR